MWDIRSFSRLQSLTLTFTRYYSRYRGTRLVSIWLDQGFKSYVMYCTVLYCTVLYCTVPYCTVLYCTVLYYKKLENLLTENRQTDKQRTKNSKTEATLILCGSSGERANYMDRQTLIINVEKWQRLA